MLPLVICFIFAFFLLYTTFAFVPPALFRTFDSDDKAFQAALGTMFLRLFGTIPAPILVGKVIDATCVVWQDYDGERGSCLVYDNVAMVKAFLTFRKCTKLFKRPKKEASKFKCIFLPLFFILHRF